MTETQFQDNPNMTKDLRLLSAVKVSSSYLPFVLSEDAQSCYFRDIDKERFVHIDFETETETEMDWEGFKEIYGHSLWTNFIKIASKEETKFLAAVIEENSGKIYIVLFSGNVSKRKVSICAEHLLGVIYREEPYLLLQKSNECDIYSIAYMRNENLKTTTISVCKIGLSGSADITSAVIFDGKTVDGLWFSPFIAGSAIHFRPGSNPENKIIKIPFDGANYSIIPMSCTCASCKNKQGHSFRNARSSNVSVFDERFSFVSNDGKNICLLSIKMCSSKLASSSSTKFNMSIEEQLRMKTSDHMLKIIDLQISSNGTAFFSIESTIYQLQLSILASKYKTGKEVLGEGTYGSVVKGTLSNEGEVAVKIMKGSPTESIHLRRKLLLSAMTEAKKLKTIEHKNIVKTFGYKIEEHRFLLFLELMQESVRDKIKRLKKLDEQEAFSILQQALEGLVYLHTLKPKPIVHRDIKCANLLISNSGEVKLGDFGLVETVYLTSTGSTDPVHGAMGTAGTPFWQAPEVISNSAPYGRKSDVWSMGCSMVEMLTGYPPYSEMRIMEWAIKASNGTLSYNPTEFISNTASVSIILLGKMFRRETKINKLKKNQSQNIRAHSWEILADIVELTTVQPLQRQWEDLQQLLAPLQQELKPRHSQVVSLRKQIQSLQEQLQTVQQKLELLEPQVKPLERQVRQLQLQEEPLEKQLETAQKYVKTLRTLSNTEQGRDQTD